MKEEILLWRTYKAMPFLLSQSWAAVHAFCLSFALQSHKLDCSSFLQPSKKKCRGFFHRKSYLRKVDFEIKEKKITWKDFQKGPFFKDYLEQAWFFSYPLKQQHSFAVFRDEFISNSIFTVCIWYIVCACACTRVVFLYMSTLPQVIISCGLPWWW